LKNKKKTYVLITLVIVVWGTIAYKIIIALNPDLPDIQQKEFAINNNYKVDTKIDTFSITVVNRDPFLGTYTKKPLPKPKLKKKTLIWKPVKYHGMVKKGNNQMFIISINGTQCLLKKGQITDSIKLIYGNSKSVTMQYKNNSKTFSLN
jgi:predicted ribosome-associated RNA-binding protein Tma20